LDIDILAAVADGALGWGGFAGVGGAGRRIVVAVIAVPLALPTFFEIPLARILLASGAPVGAAVALLVAGPSVNLPSLLTIMRSTNWKVSAVVAASIWTLAVAAGILVSFL